MPEYLSHRYRVLAELGSGAFGQTFLAEDTHLPSNRRCVVKRLKPVVDASQFQLVRERFQREAAVLEKLGEESQGRIPKLYAYFAEGGELYLVQEWIDGMPLTQKLLERGRLPESAIRELLVNLLPTLEYLHAQRIIHRDIKPDNIIIRRQDGMPVLIDFGVVKEAVNLDTHGHASTSIIAGTPIFMPQEQAAGKPVFASDLYSLGMTAVFLLTGKSPREMHDPLTGEITWRQFAPGVSEQLAMVLQKAIEPHFRDRFQTAREMLNALQGNQMSTISTMLATKAALAPTTAAPLPQTQPTSASPTFLNTSLEAKKPFPVLLVVGIVVIILGVGGILLAQFGFFGKSHKKPHRVESPEIASSSSSTSDPAQVNSSSSTPTSEKGPQTNGSSPGHTKEAPPSKEPKPPPVVNEEASPPIVRRSEGVLRGMAIHRVIPEYPPLARTARVEGDVVVEITISSLSGEVIAARCVSGHPLLQSSALNAARQWKFDASNAIPSKVVGVLTFRYTLH